tara:strand:+ start:573 stop:863 length:291 start_codon:yes stop_codon:yes gene_type:complete
MVVAVLDQVAERKAAAVVRLEVAMKAAVILVLVELAAELVLVVVLEEMDRQVEQAETGVKMAQAEDQQDRRVALDHLDHLDLVDQQALKKMVILVK